MELALRRRLAGVAEISISQQQQRVRVTFVPGTQSFSAPTFRSAIAEADVDVISIDARVCGAVDETGALRSSANDQERLVQLRGDVRPGSSRCVMGRLDEGAEPYGLEVRSAQLRR
jgi:hypothetical protein